MSVASSPAPVVCRPPGPLPRPWPAFPAAAAYVPGFVLFLVLNATLFLRPAELVPALLGWHIYVVLILLGLVMALPAVLQQLTGPFLSTRPITVCVLGLLVAVVLSHLAHFAVEDAVLYGFEYAKLVIYYLLLVAIVNSPARLRVFLFCFAVFTVVLTALAVLQYHGLIKLINLSALKDTLYDSKTNREVTILRLRGTGIFMDPNDLCLVLVVGILLSLYWLGERRLGATRLFWVAALLLFGYALYLTRSRGGFLGFLVGLVVYGVARFGLARSMILATVALPILYVFFAGRQTDLSPGSNTGLSRVQVWSDGLVMFKDSPLFGVGMDQYSKYAGQVAHNSFVHSFTELGLLGGALFLGAWGLALVALRRLGSGRTTIIDPRLRQLYPYMLGIIAAYATGMMSLSVGYIVPTYTILGLATAYLGMTTVYPPRPKIVFDMRFMKRLAIASVIFLVAVYIFLRIFLRWAQVPLAERDRQHPEIGLRMNKKVVGITGSGQIGRDPFDRRSWSGSSYFFFSELKRQGLLHRAFGVEVPTFKRYVYMARNVSRERQVWREHFYMDIAYRHALTEEIRKHLTADDLPHDFLQLGAMYDVPRLLEGRARCFSYHDGNLAEALRSPNAPKGLSARVVDRALAYEKEVYHGIACIFAMSEYLRQSFIRDFDVPAERVAAIGAGINLEAIPEYVSAKRYDSREVLFIGVDFARKGGLELLKAFRGVRQRFADARLHLVGPRELTIPPELETGVVFHGFLDKRSPAGRTKLAELFRRCCLFAMPSLYEPFGIAPLEAMVNQIPCVVTDRWALKEMVTPGRTGDLVECGSVDDLETKLSALLADAETLRRMGEEGRQTVLNYYTWDKVVQRLAAGIRAAA